MSLWSGATLEDVEARLVDGVKRHEYNDEPLFKVMGDSASTRIMVFLLDTRHITRDYTKTELCKLTGLSRQSIYNGIRPLLSHDILIVKRRIGNTTLYGLNPNSEVVRNVELIRRQLSQHLNTPPSI